METGRIFWEIYFLGVLGNGQGIAYGAHIGGFVTGAFISLVAQRFIR